MKEALFLKRHADKWTQYESLLDGGDDPDLLAEGYIELTDDLAFARTFYPWSKTTSYLNGLAARFHQRLYRNKKEDISRIWSFWRFELPYLFRQYHRQLLYAFLFFLVFACIGVISVQGDARFVRVVLGDSYVNRTLDHIRQGDPFGVYDSDGPAALFIFIALNNIRVSFLAYVLGISGGILTVVMLMYNSIMVGAFEAFFFQHGLGTESILTVFIHGTIEVSVLIIACCAGMILGSSILFPRSLPRGRSMLRGGRDAMKIVIGLMPFFLVAAFLESVVTRHSMSMPVLLRVLILAGSLALILWYFIFYPVRLHRRVDRATAARTGGGPDKAFDIWLTRKLSAGK